MYLGISVYELCVWVERVGLLLRRASIQAKRNNKDFVRFGQRYDSLRCAVRGRCKTAGYRRIGIHLSHSILSNIYAIRDDFVPIHSIQSRCVYTNSGHGSSIQH